MSSKEEDRTWAMRYASMLHDACMWGNTRECRHGGRVSDLGPIHFNLPFLPRWVQVEGRNGSAALAQAEPLAYVAGLDAGSLLPVAPYLDRFRSTVGAQPWPGSYGPRISEGIPDVLRALDHDPFTRQAVLHIHDRGDNSRAVRAAGSPADIPCTLSLGFWFEDWSGLCCHAIMRSSDAFRGFYYDVPAFGFIARRVADVLGWKYGRFWFTTTSMHVYAQDTAKALRISSDPVVVESLPDTVPWPVDSTASLMARWIAVQLRAKSMLRSMVDARAHDPQR
jgi:hypothetical protein